MRAMGSALVAIALLLGMFSFVSASYENIQIDQQANQIFQQTEPFDNNSIQTMTIIPLGERTHDLGDNTKHRYATITNEIDFENGPNSIMVKESKALPPTELSLLQPTIVAIPEDDKPKKLQRDVTPPVFISLPDLVVEATGFQTIIDFVIPTVSDLEDPFPIVTNDAPAKFLLGETVVTWTATDSSGNSATVTQLVKLLDTTSPELTTALIPIFLEENEGFFEVEVNSIDQVDPNPIVLVAINNIEVSNGQVVKLELDDIKDSKIKDGILEIKDQNFLMIASSTDSFGNSAVSTVTPEFLEFEDGILFEELEYGFEEIFKILEELEAVLAYDLYDLDEIIFEFDYTSDLIFESELQDIAQTTNLFEERIEDSPDSTEELQEKFEEKLKEIREKYQNIKAKWKEEFEKFRNDAKALLKEKPGIKSRILEQDIEKLKIRFDAKEEKVKNADKTQKKIKTAIELGNLKKEFRDSMNEYVITEKTMKYGTEKEKKLEQLKEKTTKLMKAVLLAEAKHNDKKLNDDDLKKIDQKVTEEIKNSVGENAGQTDSGDSTNGNSSDKGNNGKGSGKSKGNGKSKK